MLDPGLALSAAVVLAGGVAWAKHVEGRVDGHDSLFEEREKIDTARHTELLRRLQRIEDSQDEAAKEFREYYRRSS